MPNIKVNSSILLPPDMEWVDEHTWSPVLRRPTYGLTGALILQTSKKQTGRPLTLRSTLDTAWVKRTVVEALVALDATNPELKFSLEMASGAVFQVMFANIADKSAIEAEAVQPGKFKAPDDYFRITLNFMEVNV